MIRSLELAVDKVDLIFVVKLGIKGTKMYVEDVVAVADML